MKPMSPPIPPPLLLNQLEQNVATSLVIEREPMKGSLPTVFPTSRGIHKITFGVVFACQNGCLCVLSTHCPPSLNIFKKVQTQQVGKVSRRYKSLLVPSDNLLLGKRLTSSTSICMSVSQLESYASRVFATAFVLLSTRNFFGHPPRTIVNGCFIFTKQSTVFPVC